MKEKFASSPNLYININIYAIDEWEVEDKEENQTNTQKKTIND